MKSILNFIGIGIVLSLSFTACKEDYIDAISKVAPGNDALAPTVSIISPAISTVVIPFTDTKTNYTFKFSASDDIELKNIDIALNGVKLASFTSFIDYRSYTGTYEYKDLAIGNHSFVVTATDLSGKTTSKPFAFTVTNKYQPIFPSEVFFVPFDNPSTDPLKIASDIVLNTSAIANTTSTTAGISGNAMQGGGLNYVTYTKPNNWISTSQSFSLSFWFKLNGQTKNNAGTNGPEYIFSIPSSNGHWSGGQTLLFFETNSTGTQIKFPVVAADMTDTWFVWEGGNAIPGIADNSWKHCALVYDASTSKMTLYINGVANAITAQWGTHGNINMNETTATSFRLGAGPQDINGSDNWLGSTWKGGLDQFRLFNAALSASDVKSIFDAKY
jgi:hypothetical protein